MRKWTVPWGQTIRLPRGIRMMHSDPETGGAVYRHERLKTWYRVTRGRSGWRVEEWSQREVDAAACDRC